MGRYCPPEQNPRSLPAREVWIEITINPPSVAPSESLPAREVWIEITLEAVNKVLGPVTSRKGSVD